MKKAISILLIIVLTVAVGLAVTGCEEGAKVTLTIAETTDNHPAIEKGFFFARGGDGSLYKVLYSDTSKLSEKQQVVVTYQIIKTITYPNGYPEGFRPSYQIEALSVR